MEREAGRQQGRGGGVAAPPAPARSQLNAAGRLLARIADRLEEATVAAVLLFMTGLAFANVIARYLTRTSLAFSEELLVNLFVWMSLFGAAIGVRRGAHASVDLLVARLPRPVRSWVRVATYAFSAVAVSVLVYQGCRLVSFQYAVGAKTYSMSLPVWWFSAGVPLGGAAILLRLVQAAWRDLRAGSAPEAPPRYREI